MPSALILGALTVVGVELVKVLVTSGRFSPIRAVDISLLELAEISDDYKQYFKQVEFVQANFVLKTAASKCFDREGEFDYVFNCGIHLKPDSSEEYYRLYLMQRALHAATEAAKRGVKVFVEESSAYDYAVKGKGDWCTEADPMAKRGLIGTCRVETVEALRQIPGLNLIVVRCGMLYGPTEKVRMATALLTAYMLHRGGEGLEWALPYDPEMRLNSVHSHDAARAMLHVTEWYVAQNKTGVEIFNVGDDGDSSKHIDIVTCECRCGKRLQVPLRQLPVSNHLFWRA
jgi:nucleoside-diphosphate-sugar epimerase